MTNKQHLINYTTSKGIYGRNNQCGAKGETMLFFTETEWHEPRVTGAPRAFTSLLLHFAPNVHHRWNTQDSISQSIRILLPEATRVK